MSNCRLTIRLLSPYVDGELYGQDMLEIRRHLSECAKCSAEHQSMIKVKTAIGRLPMKDPSPNFELKLHQHLFDSNARLSMSRWRMWLDDVQSLMSTPVSRRRLALVPAGLAGFAIWAMLSTPAGDNGALVIGSGAPLTSIAPDLSYIQRGTIPVNLAPMTPTFSAPAPTLNNFQNNHAADQLNDFSGQTNGVGHLGLQTSIQTVSDVSMWGNRP